MREVTQLTNNRFLNIKQVVDEEHGCAGYQFAERRGIDSVAFVCYNRNTEMVLLNHEFKPPINCFLTGGFGGSLDKEASMIDVVIDEVREEAGFEVGKDDIITLDPVFVSTQMNQFCHLYLVYVDTKNQKDRQPENKCESLAKLEWRSIHSQDFYKKLSDWKAITIIAKAEREGLL